MSAISMSVVSKKFGTLLALDRVNLEVERGTMHALVGENGAGKTTLMRVLSGALQADGGEIKIDGQAVHIKSPAHAARHGIGMVSQHFSIIPELSCLDNLMLGAEGGPVLSRRSAKARAEELATDMGFKLDWGSLASELSPASMQKLEILKLLWRKADIMILDEPTAMLSPQDSHALFQSLSGLVNQGRTVILVTHRLPEVIQYCRRVTVLRGGKNAGDKMVAGTSAGELAGMIVGTAPISQTFPQPGRNPNVLLEVNRLSVLGDRGDLALKQATFNLHREEILGIAGVDGNGQRELVQALLGVRKVDAGVIRFEGSDVSDSPVKMRLRLGFRSIPEDRHAEGMVEDWTVEENAALGLQRFKPFSIGPFISGKGRQGTAKRIAQRFDARQAGPKVVMRNLSGGNQQRFVAARALELWPTVIVAFQPTRGLDIRAIERFYSDLRQVCNSGPSAIVVGFELDDLLLHCDRILVLNHGMIRTPAPGYERDREAIGRLMVGAT